MSSNVFAPLFECYEGVIEEMPPVFSSHQFILRLAQQNQAQYIEALYNYQESPNPFQIVHGLLARHLSTVTGLKRLPDGPSTDIFGRANHCARWKKM